MAIIYEPRGQAREYAPLAVNVYRGCDHGCIYCYGPSATQRKREQFHESCLRPNFFPQLVREAKKRAVAGDTGQVLLSFTCDPYQHLDVEERVTRRTIEILHRYGFTVQILTKGGTRALRDLDLLGPGDAFASTLTFVDEARSREWEPNAALPDDRIEAIREMHDAGVPTWVSLEPVVDPNETLAVIRRTFEFVDLYKVGKLNYHPHAKTVDWGRFANDAVALLEETDVPFYVKDSLLPYLPADFEQAGMDHYQLAEGPSPKREPLQPLLL